MPPEISVVVPLYNEASNVGALHEELTAVLRGLGGPYELILVDDGSTDGTFEALAGLHGRDPRLVVIRFRRNFGQTAAFAAGFDRARGRIIVTLDGDLQNDPRDIPALVARLEEGFDLVSGWRRERADRWLTRRVPSQCANWLISLVTGVKLHDYGCSLKAYRAEAIKPVALFGELHRFIPALVAARGARVAEMVVSHRPRRSGASKYGLSRIGRVLLDLLLVKCLVSYATRPLRMFGPPGLLLGAAGFGVSGYVAAAWLRGAQPLGGAVLLPLGMLLLMLGIQLVGLGLLAELQIRTVRGTGGNPPYAVREMLESRSESAS